MKVSDVYCIQDDAIEVARELVAIATRKSFLSEVCAVAMGNLVESGCYDNGEDVRLGVVRECGLSEGWGKGCTPERLYLYLRLRESMGGESWWKQLAKKWHERENDVFSTTNLSSLIAILEVLN